MDQPLHRLFFALRPPAGAAAYIDDCRARLGQSGRPVGLGRLHVTLNILDDWPFRPWELIRAMIGIGAAVSQVTAPFRVNFDQLIGTAHSMALRPSEAIEALRAFQRQLAAALARVGVPTRRGTRFSPHLTLAYGSYEALVAAAEPVSWRVEDFLLIESLVGRTEHLVHGRWSLVGGASKSAPPRGFLPRGAGAAHARAPMHRASAPIGPA